MRIVNEPKYESFTGSVYTSQARCEREDKEYRIHILEELKKLKKYCNNNINCDECPFALEHNECSIALLIKGDMPANWRDWE